MPDNEQTKLVLEINYLNIEVLKMYAELEKKLLEKWLYSLSGS